jgi:hypothetical protein
MRPISRTKRLAIADSVATQQIIKKIIIFTFQRATRDIKLYLIVEMTGKIYKNYYYYFLFYLFFIFLFFII